uniref:Dishevelled n=2 Tax=Mesocestoides corti TaxID=53468 RepID=A0A5K3EU03_MESCO
MEDTKIIYHIDEENTPYLVKLAVNADKVTLGDFKAALNRPNYKFFFKSVDADFGVVKEEISDDSACLPCFNGRVIAWLVTADGSAKSDNHSSTGDALVPKSNDPHDEASRNAASNKRDNRDECETCGDSESACSGDHLPPLRNFQNYKHGSRLGKLGRVNQSIYDTSSSMLSSDLESTSFFDSEDESSRFSTTTGTTVSSMRYGGHRQRRRRRSLPISRISEDASSYSSMTDSTMSLNIVTVTLKMDTVNYLGISIVGQSNRAGDGGIYVGSIMRGGAVALDGRIEPGDMLLEVNSISFEDMSNDDAVRVLREQVQKPGPITLVVAKCWDPNPQSNCFVLSRQEPVRPIDPRAWVLHTNAMTAAGAVASSGGLHPEPVGPLSDTNSAFCSNFPVPGGGAGSGVLLPLPKSNASSSSVTAKSGPDSSGGGGGGGGGGAVAPSFLGHHPQASSQPSDLTTAAAAVEQPQQLNVATEMAIVVRAMLQPESGLEIHDRTWLKITIANAVIGSDLVDWLFANVDGFADRREVRKYASNMLKCGFIQHTVNKTTFSEQCYYVFSDLAGTVLMNLEEMDSVSEIGVSRHPQGVIGLMPQNNGTSSVSSVPGGSFACSLPSFSAANSASPATAAIPPQSAAPGAGFWPSGGGQPLFPTPPIHPQQHHLAMSPPNAPGLNSEHKSVDLKSIVPTQLQQRPNVGDDDGTSSASSSSSTSTSSSSSSCSSATRQAPPQSSDAAVPLTCVPPSAASHAPPQPGVAASVHSVNVTPCSCLHLRRRRRSKGGACHGPSDVAAPLTPPVPDRHPAKDPPLAHTSATSTTNLPDCAAAIDEGAAAADQAVLRDSPGATAGGGRAPRPLQPTLASPPVSTGSSGCASVRSPPPATGSISDHNQQFQRTN